MALDFTPSFTNTFIIVYTDEKKTTFATQAFALRTQVGIGSVSNLDEISQFSNLAAFNSALSAVGQSAESFNPFTDSVPAATPEE